MGTGCAENVTRSYWSEQPSAHVPPVLFRAGTTLMRLPDQPVRFRSRSRRYWNFNRSRLKRPLPVNRMAMKPSM